MCYALAGNASGPALHPAEAGNIIDRKRNFIAQNLPSPPFHCLNMTEIFLKRVIHPSNYWTEHNSHWKKYRRTSLARLLMTRLSRLVVELVLESLEKSPIAADLDGWMTCDFTSFLTVFKSYQDDVWMIMKGCVQWNSVYGWEDFTSSEDRTRSARSVGQRLTHWATGAPCRFGIIKDGFLFYIESGILCVLIRFASIRRF